MQIIPAVLEPKFEDADEKIGLVRDLTRWVQIDVIDNVLTPGKTFELEQLRKLSFNSDNLLWDIHLMVKEPIKWIKKCDYVNASRIIGQVEMMNDREEFVATLKNIGIEAGLAFNTDTVIDCNIPEDTDMVLLMGRPFGFGEYEMDKDLFDRIQCLKQVRTDLDLDFAIGVDGGVTEKNLPTLLRLGVSVAYCTGAIFKGNVKNNWEKLNSML